MEFKIKTFTFNPFQENSYVLYNDDKDCIIIDPGCSTESERQELKSFIVSQDLKPQILVNTHCHIDHVLGNAFVQKEWGLPLLIHSGERPLLEASPALAELYAVAIPEIPEDIQYLDDMEELAIGNNRLKILFTPGHSPAHICLYDAESEILIAGDVIFRESIGRTDLPGGDYNTLINSIETVLWKLPDHTIVFPGHGPSTTIGYEKENNPFL